MISIQKIGVDMSQEQNKRFNEIPVFPKWLKLSFAEMEDASYEGDDYVAEFLWNYRKTKNDFFLTRYDAENNFFIVVPSDQLKSEPRVERIAQPTYKMKVLEEVENRLDICIQRNRDGGEITSMSLETNSGEQSKDILFALEGLLEGINEDTQQ